MSRVTHFINGRTSTRITANSQNNIKHKEVNVFCVYISSGNLVTTFKINARQDTQKLHESVTGMRQVLRQVVGAL